MKDGFFYAEFYSADSARLAIVLLFLMGQQLFGPKISKDRLRIVLLTSLSKF